MANLEKACFYLAPGNIWRPAWIIRTSALGGVVELLMTDGSILYAGTDKIQG